MIVFQNPFVFLLLFLIPLYYILKKINLFSQPKIPLTFSDWDGQGFEWNPLSDSVLRIISKITFIGGFVFLVISLSNPTIENQERVYTSRSSEVVFVIDVSPSMASLDIAEGTRLDAAKKAIDLLVSENQGTAYGLVACGTEAALLVPPTMDRSVFFTRLEEMQIGELGDKTSLGLGISTAVYHLLSTYAPRKSIVLLTDGDNNAGAVHPETAANLAKEYGITLYVAGIGTRGSVPIEYVDPESGKMYTGYLDSTFDNSILRNLANITDGKYFTVETLSSLSQALETVTVESSIAQSYRIKQTSTLLYAQTLFISLLLFSITWLVSRLLLREVL